MLNVHLVHVAAHSPVYKLCSSVMLYLQVLESFGIIGYSLLLTVHYMQEGRGGDLVCVLLGCLVGRGEEWEGVGTWCVLLGCLGEEERRQIKKDSLHVHV